MIGDSNDKVITSNAETDDTQIGVEKYTGARIFSKERIFMNMVFKGGDLVQNVSEPPNGFFFPLVFTDKNSKMT